MPVASSEIISFSNDQNLHNCWLSFSFGYNMQIVMHVTHKRFTAAVNKHGIRVNMLSGKATPESFILIQAQIDSMAVHTQAYHTMWRAL